jgi:hypothetical protein
MNLRKCSSSAIKERGVYAFVETLIPHAIQIRQPGGPEVLNPTALEARATSGSIILTISPSNRTP